MEHRREVAMQGRVRNLVNVGQNRGGKTQETD